MKPCDTKFLFTDLDGTLLDSNKNISRADLDSINRMVDAGHKFAVVTGRPLPSALALCEEYDFIRDGFYIASYNGGLIYDPYNKQTVQELPVPFDYVSPMFAAAGEAGVHIHTYTDTHVVSERQTEKFDYYLKHIKMPGLIVPNVLDALDRPPIKMIVMSLKGREVLNAFRDKMLPFTEGRLTGIFSNDKLLEYAVPENSKGNAVKMLCAHFGIPVSNAIACGDEENDIAMIVDAGIGVVMANGNPEVKAYADYITTHTNDESPMTEVIEKFILP